MEQHSPPMNRKKGWAVLLLTCLCLYLFAVYLGPWMEVHVFVGMEEMAQVIEENGIDAGAYYYTEIEGAHQGHNYLRQSMQIMAPDEFGLTLPFISGLFICLLILWFGFKTLPK